MRRLLGRMLFSRGAGTTTLVLTIILAITAVTCAVRVRHDDRYLRDVGNHVWRAADDDERNAIRLMHFIHGACFRRIDPQTASFTARIEDRLPFKLTPVTILKEGFALGAPKYEGTCGPMSRVMVAIARLRGIEARKVLVTMKGSSDEHCMATLWIDGGWRLFDPAIDFYWTNKMGHVATLEEVCSYPTIFKQVYRADDDFPYRFNDAGFFRWKRLGPLAGPTKSLLTAVKGERWVADLDTPTGYDRPFLGYGYTSVLLGLFFAGWTWDGWHRRRRDQARGVAAFRRSLANE